PETNPDDDTATTTTVATSSLDVYLVRDDRVTRVSRVAAATDIATVLNLLAAGPTEREVERGLRTALVPELVSLAEVAEVADAVATIDLT
ncbi:MAG TPA: hypothetical protein PLV68_17360, partial [Ilumatobacteraceae bacterium]|nr:hypothetical protein [Ilumatobacteraceae bacterium]